MYAALARAVLNDSDRDRVAAQVRRLRGRHPHASRDALAERLIRRTALQCAAAGALMTGPATFFGAMPFGADLAYQAVALHRLVLALGILYGQPPSGRNRAAGMAVGLAAGLSSDLLRQGLVQVLRRALPRRSGSRTCAGALGGGVLGYVAAVAVGRFARDTFRGARRFAIPARIRR